MMHSEVAVTRPLRPSYCTTRTEIGASAHLEDQSLCVEQHDRPIIMRVVQKQLYLLLSAWIKGLKCTEKACKILRKGNLRRQCYNMMLLKLLKMAGPLEVTKCSIRLPFIMIHHQSKFIQVK